jgi:uncharacterized Zn-binding protein involved in type VI secretion
MMLVFRSQLVTGRMGPDTTGAVERHMAVVMINDGPVIDVGDVHAAHVHDRAVIEV